MDRERVIKGLEEILDYFFAIYRKDTDSYTCEKAQEYSDVAIGAIALLKEQEQRKQIVRKQCKKEHENGSIDYFAEWYCPHCNSLILRGFDNPSIKFCYKCGKPIKWEGQ